MDSVNTTLAKVSKWVEMYFTLKAFPNKELLHLFLLISANIRCKYSSYDLWKPMHFKFMVNYVPIISKNLN